jgi:sugar phosphate isomerase/epimerase
MKHKTIAKTLLPLNATRKLAKPVVICISALLLLSMVSILMTSGVQAATSTSSMALHTEGNLIVDASGNTIYLRGLQKVELADDPDGTWNGNALWSDANVEAELDEMVSWGANTIRCIQSVDNWKYDLDTPYSSISSREAVKRLIEFAAERDMYVIFTGYRVTNYFNGGNQDPLPYPPYQTSAGASSVISSKQDFIDWWADVANELKDYDNVLFEIWNEPKVDSAAAAQEYFGVQQQVIDAIRATGAENLILAQWDMGSWVDLDYGGGSTMYWVDEANLVDPLDSLVYVTHLYREYGQTGIYSSAESIAKWGTTHAYDYDELKRAFNAEGIDYILNTLNKPIFVTECGANMDLSGAEANYEQQALANELKIFNEWGINWIVHWFREIGIFRLHTGAPNFTPTAGGTITQQYLQEQKVFPSDGTTTPTETATPTETPDATSTPSTTETPDSTSTPTTTQTPSTTETPTQTDDGQPSTTTEPTPTTSAQIDINNILQPFHYWRFWGFYYFPYFHFQWPIFFW